MANYGKDTIGASNEALGADTKWFCKFTAPGDIGAVDSITAYLNRTAPGGGYAIRGGIYTDNAGVPDALVANSEIVIDTNIARNSPNWYSVSYTTKPNLTPGAVYWLGVQAAKDSLTYYDAGAADQQKQANDTYTDGLANPFGAVTATHAHEQSVYVSYTPASQIISNAGNISSLEAFGVSKLNLSLFPSSIASLEAFGSSKLNLAMSPSGIPSGETFGSPKLNLALFPTAIASAEVFGTPKLLLYLLPSAIASLEAFGTPVISQGTQTITNAGAITSLEAFGAAKVNLTLVPTGIPSLEAWGTAMVILTLLPSGIPSGEALGTPKLILSLLPTGIASLEAFGLPKITIMLLPLGIASGELWGTPTIASSSLYLLPSGIESQEVWGTPKVFLRPLWRQRAIILGRRREHVYFWQLFIPP